MVETENFIKEVSEEVRKDKLFKTLRSYSWGLLFSISSVILAVGGYEYYKYDKKIKSEENGKLLSEYVESLGNEKKQDLDIPSGSFLEAITKLHRAKFFVKNNDLSSAKKLYEEVIDNPDAGNFFKKYAMLMLYMLSPAESLNEKDKIKSLDELSAPGSPLQILALEQKVLLFLKLNDLEKAKYHINLITENPGVTPEQLERIKEVRELYDFD